MSSVRRLLVLFALGAAFGPAATAHGQVDPTQDPFYAAPADIASRPNGSVINGRAVRSAIPTATAVQVQYRSTDGKGAPVAAVTTLLTPALPWLGAGPRPLISYQVGYDALAAHCAPSYTLRSGAEPEIAPILTLLGLGYAVAVPDHEGPARAWTAGPLSAHTVLDGVRALHSLPAVGPLTPTALYGYAGGGTASAWAAEQAPVYAPELALRGIAAGGLAPDPLDLVRATDGTHLAGVGFAALLGLERQYPELGLTPRLNDSGRAVAAAIAGQCADAVERDYGGRRLAELVADPAEEPLSRYLPQVVFQSNRLGKQAPEMPAYLFHAAADPAVPVRGPDALATRWCRDGATVFYERDATGAATTHQLRTQLSAFGWLADRLADAPAPGNCGATPPAELAAFCPTGGSAKFRVRRVRGEKIRRVVVRQDGRRVADRRGRSIRRVVVRKLVPGTYDFEVKRVTDRHRRFNAYRRTVVCKQRVV